MSIPQANLRLKTVSVSCRGSDQLSVKAEIMLVGLIGEMSIPQANLRLETVSVSCRGSDQLSVKAEIKLIGLHSGEGQRPVEGESLRQSSPFIIGEVNIP